tara:strand:+ start:112 stop:918 length:807 start_codon:yes stop_codon:yes gene_type:complete
MTSSPLDSSEFGEAIKRTLSHGEDLVCFANAWQVTGRIEQWRKEVPDGSRDLILYEWIYLALTSINIRIGVWKKHTKKTGLFKKEISVLPECEPRQQFGLQDVVLATSFTWEKRGRFSHYSYPIPELMQSKRNHTFDYPFHGLPKGTVHDRIFFMRLSLSNSLELEVASYFDALRNFGQNLDQRKSGGLIAKEASKAADALAVLTPLLQEGIISQEEFDRAKAGFLGTTTEAQENSASQIRQLHSLHKDGILTEGEFNMKKWDILSKN